MIVELSISCELSSCIHRIIASTSRLLALGTRSKPGGMYPADLVVRLRLTNSKAEDSLARAPLLTCLLGALARGMWQGRLKIPRVPTNLQGGWPSELHLALLSKAGASHMRLRDFAMGVKGCLALYKLRCRHLSSICHARRAEVLGAQKFGQTKFATTKVAYNRRIDRASLTFREQPR